MTATVALLHGTLAGAVRTTFATQFQHGIAVLATATEECHNSDGQYARHLFPPDEMIPQTGDDVNCHLAKRLRNPLCLPRAKALPVA